MMEFTNTEAYKILKSFIFQIDNSIKNERQEDTPDDFIIFKIENIIKNTPLSETKGRYANPGMVDVIEQIEKLEENEYLKNSFGNKIRMDFGTGHELNFLCYLYTKIKDGLIKINQVKDILKYYFRYIRFYIKKFNIEAAGSRGCWSIDDYLLLPYLFGSSENYNENRSIMIIGSGLYKEAYQNNPSPLISKISKNSWQEINIEMIRLYDELVFQKKVITQHFIFSEYLPNN